MNKFCVGKEKQATATLTLTRRAKGVKHKPQLPPCQSTSRSRPTTELLALALFLSPGTHRRCEMILVANMSLTWELMTHDSPVPLYPIYAQTMGIVAHPNEVTGLAVSFDGRFLFSAGGFDLSVNMWKIDVEEHKRSRERAAAVLAGDADEDVPLALRNSVEAAALRPYFSLLEGGEGGELHHDIIDYFYYCQLRTLGEDSMEARSLTGEIPLEEMPSLFRSVGFYPSEDEVLNMVNEVRYKNFVNTGETQDFVGLVRCHRVEVT